MQIRIFRLQILVVPHARLSGHQKFPILPLILVFAHLVISISSLLLHQFPALRAFGFMSPSSIDCLARIRPRPRRPDGSVSKSISSSQLEA